MALSATRVRPLSVRLLSLFRISLRMCICIDKEKIKLPAILLWLRKTMIRNVCSVVCSQCSLNCLLALKVVGKLDDKILENKPVLNHSALIGLLEREEGITVFFIFSAPPLISAPLLFFDQKQKGRWLLRPFWVTFLCSWRKSHWFPSLVWKYGLKKECFH